MITKTLLLERLEKAGLSLPTASAPAGAYVGTRIHGNILFVAGQIPMKEGEIIYKGKVGQDCTVETGQQSARLCALNILSQIDHALDGNWERFDVILRLNGFVNSEGSFGDHPKVINGASELMAEILGDTGIHTRIALGASSLPFNAATEIDAVIGLK